MSEPNWIAWAAGFFEGEGSFSRGGKKGGRGHILLSISNTDLDMLERFKNIVDSGNIYTMGKGNLPGRKPCWCWNAWVQDDVDRIVAQFWPYLRERRQLRYTELHVQRSRLARERR